VTALLNKPSAISTPAAQPTGDGLIALRSLDEGNRWRKAVLWTMPLHYERCTKSQRVSGTTSADNDTLNEFCNLSRIASTADSVPTRWAKNTTAMLQL
jgi:hypothetical protein